MGPEEWDNPDWDIGCWDEEPDPDIDLEDDTAFRILEDD